MLPEFHEEILVQPTRELFDKLPEHSWVSRFYLAGGTALALQLGHRISVDLDFFSAADFNERELIPKLSTLGQLEVFQTAPQSVTGALQNVKVSFLGYKYPLLKPVREFRGINLASVEDIACMKLDALSSRGTKRDFIDLYFIARHLPLTEMLHLFEQKYAAVKFNLLHVKKSLVYFEDAEHDPMPDMLRPVTWNQVKEFFITNAASL